jgi:hypothetical protein
MQAFDLAIILQFAKTSYPAETSRSRQNLPGKIYLRRLPPDHGAFSSEADTASREETRQIKKTRTRL